MNSARRGTPTLSVDACEIAVRLSTRSTRSLERCLVDPKRAISDAISATSAPASQSAVTATVSDEARSNLRCDGLRSRTRMRRVTLSIIDGDNATRSSKVVAENEASVVSRTARTVADRGARSSRPNSPTTSPRPSSATSRSLPSSRTCTDTRPPTTKYAASATSPCSNRTSPASRRRQPTRSTTCCTIAWSVLPISSAIIVATFVRSTRSRASSETRSAISGWLLSQSSKSTRSISNTSTGPLAMSVAVRSPPATTVTSPMTWPASTVPTIMSPCGVAFEADILPDSTK